MARQQLDTQRKAQLVRSLKMADIGILNAQALAAQGNISLAQDAAKQAVDTKYAPYKELLETLKMQSEKSGNVLITNLSWETISSPKHLQSLIAQSHQNKTFKQTIHNDRSS